MSDNGAPGPSEAAYDAVIFDLGGVILHLTYGATIAALSELLGRDARDIYQETSQDSLFDRFERGEWDEARFRDALRGESRQVSPPNDADLDLAWNAVLGRIPDENLTLLRTLHRKKRLFLLSNTNSIHLTRFQADYAERHLREFGPFSQLFERDYYSHELGLRKPDARAFQHILATHGLDAARTLFIDDNEHNVSAAAALGLLTLLHPRNGPLAPYFSGP